MCKRPSAVVFAENLQALIIGDKAGDTYAVTFPDVTLKKKLLFGHCSSIITSLAVSADGRYLISADRDEKVRVTCFPSTHIIQSFCMGHTEFVSAVITLKALPNLLISGAGDGTVRLWSLDSGLLLDTVVRLLPLLSLASAH